MKKDPQNNSKLFQRLYSKALKWYAYASNGVWNDTRNNLGVKIIKTLNLSVRSFLNGDLQIRACALTYQTVLAVVPALALAFAIGRGFGFQNMMEEMLIKNFPAQRTALREAFGFVDSYLNQSSEGLFVGVGIIFLLYTLISLLTYVEDAFDLIWGVKQGRTLWRKLTDYTSILMILPILMICAAGFMMYVSNFVQSVIPSGFLTPLIKLSFDAASVALVWLFFAAAYKLIPNAKVKFSNALLAGVLAGSAFCVLQWLFVTGQVYVTRYNAIYGSFSFLPLLLIWLQLVWTITLSGAIICFSSQSIFEFSFAADAAKISPAYKWKVLLAVMSVIVNRFVNQQPPMTSHQIAVNYGLPVSLVNDAVNRLHSAGLILEVMVGSRDDMPAFSPAVEVNLITLSMIFDKVGGLGTSNFIPGFDRRFSALTAALDELKKKFGDNCNTIFIKDLQPQDILINK